MKVSLHQPSPLPSSPPMSAPGKLEVALAAAASDVDNNQFDHQLALVAPRSHKTRAVISKWFKAVFASNNTQSASSSSRRRRTHVGRRASTGSILEVSGGDAASASAAESSRLRRASSLFSPRQHIKENQSNSADPLAARQPKASTRAAAAPCDATLWLKPVASFSDVLVHNAASGHPGGPLTASLTSSSSVSSPSLREVIVDGAALPNQSAYLRADQFDEPAIELFEYVTPPVELPAMYRLQDRRGGMIVAGRTVLFTNAAFKRKLRNLRLLCAIPELEASEFMDAHLGVYLYGLQPFGAASYAETAEPLSEWV